MNLSNNLENESKGSMVSDDSDAVEEQILEAEPTDTNVQLQNIQDSDNLSIEQLKGIKNKTPLQKRLYEKLRKQAQREHKAIMDKSQNKMQVNRVDDKLGYKSLGIIISNLAEDTERGCKVVPVNKSISEEFSLDQLRCIKDKTPSQKKLYEKLHKLEQRNKNKSTCTPIQRKDRESQKKRRQSIKANQLFGKKLSFRS